jgi:hypothetical protein
MLKNEIVTFNGIEYIRTWSDINMMIERDGVLYEEAIDPIDSGRIYTETEQAIVKDGEAEATDEDYQSSLESLGVNFDA